MTTVAGIDITPTHLQEADLAGMQERLEAPPPPKDNPRAQRKYTFNFAWKDPHGKNWEGTFTSTILNVAQLKNAGVIQAQLGMGIAFEQLDYETRDINFMLARLQIGLDPKGRPPWAEDLGQIESLDLLRALYEEVAAHERTFRGR